MNIIKKNLVKSRLRLSAGLLASCLFSLVLYFFRMRYSHDLSFSFLVWNLFLAGIPFLISSWLYINKKPAMPGMIIFMAAATWLLFFPNAPYILTDLLHLHPRAQVPFWYDVLLMVSFAWNGFILGLVSLLDMQQVISERLGKRTGWLFALFSIGLGSFGIYLGRFERWNSWDIVTSPFNLLMDIARQVLHPHAHRQTIEVTLLFSVFIGITYLTLKALSGSRAHAGQPE